MRKLHLLFALCTALACTLLLSCGGGSGSGGAASGGQSLSENGFVYTNHTNNGGPTPQIGEYAYFNYTVFVDDSLMDNSQRRGVVPKLKIPEPEQTKANPSPVIDALKLMALNDSLTIIYPLDSMKQRPPQFANNKDIIYQIVLTAIKDQAGYDADMVAEQAEKDKAAAASQAREAEIATFSANTLTDYKGGKMGEQLKTTATGLKYIVHEEGNGPMPNKGELLKVDYYGTLTSDGKMFDNSFRRGQPFQLALGMGSVIKGWDEGLALIKKGSKATFFIPAELGYGATGSPPDIPGGAELQFYVEVAEK
ncbi:MAG: FKBP-type peptidyl-prolyl cis-trans isomerase [Bacteroidota bacterium]